MKLLFLSLILFSFGSFCDKCADFCTRLAEKNILKHKSLNKKLLIFMSNFSSYNLENWQAFERKFLKQFLENHNSRLP